MHQAAKPPRRSLLDRWFRAVRVTSDVQEELAALARTGALVFVMRSPGLLNFLYLRWMVRRLGLAPLRVAFGVSGLRARLVGARSTLSDLQSAVSRGHPAVVFLGPPGPKDPFRSLVAQQRDLAHAVLLVPALLLWSRRAQKLAPSLWDILYGSPEAPSAFATAIAFLRNYKRALFRIGRPVNLSETVRERSAEPDQVLGRKVRGALHQHLARETRAVIGPPLKTAGRVADMVLRDRSLREVLQKVAKVKGKPIEELEAEARRDLKEIASRYTPGVIEFLRPVMQWVFSRMYQSVEVDEEGLARLKRAAASAPLVLCPSHKSHVDYLLISTVLYDQGLTPPHIAAGINLSFWPFGPLARRAGAFFIRRTFKGDKIYAATLRAYVKQLLRGRFPQEFYPEGGRSRTGKLLFPKMGLFSMQIDAWLDGASDDVLFVPIAIDYELLAEGSSYARELAGGEKTQESFKSLLGARKVLGRRYGRVHFSVGEPVSLRELADRRLGDRAHSLTLEDEEPVDPDAPPGPSRADAARAEGGEGHSASEAKKQLVQHLANRVAYGINRAITITPTGLLAAAMLSHVRRGISATELSRRVELLRYVAADAGARFARGLAGAPSDPREPGPIADALSLFMASGLVRAEKAAGETIYQAVDEKRPLLDYHRNNVIHRYVSLSLFAAALRAAGGSGNTAELKERARWLARLFKLEFMYRVGATTDEIWSETLPFLARLGLVRQDGDRVSVEGEPDTLWFLADLTRAYAEAYRVVGETLLAAPSLDKKTLVRESLERGRAAFLEGRIALRESISRFTIENAADWFRQQGAISPGADGKPALDAAWRSERLPSLLRELDRQLAA
jgi:glycerol-3-phosphate O-acyltransferase